MSKCVLVFAGTIEGRAIAEHLLEHGVEVHVCVATNYGKSLFEKREGLHISHERLGRAEMENLMESVKPVLVVDATHPYAREVTENVREACANTDCACVRLLRGGQQAEDVVYVDSVEEAVEWLNRSGDKIFLTTGSKDIQAFTMVKDYRERLYARVLSLPEVVSSCANLGIEGAHLFCMQGPFSEKMNEAMLTQTGAKILVTKDTGEAGGFPEKLRAARACKVQVLVIGRPTKEEGISLLECKDYCAKQLGYQMNQKVTLVGIGMGDEAAMTGEAKEAICRAELLIGAQRMLEATARPGQHTYMAYKPQLIAEYLEAHPEYEEIAVVLSGDVGFYSGARKLVEYLRQKPKLICGISSMAYFCAKLGKSWDEVHHVTMHGREKNLTNAISTHQKVFGLMGSADGIGRACTKLAGYGFGSCYAAVGENLGYETERIREGSVSDFVGIDTEKLSVLYLENPGALDRIVTHGISDCEFLRDKAPMTKEEVRSISLSKLRLRADSVIYDVGAGSGSISVEAALQAGEGWVYAIEKKAEAVELICKNSKKFAADNLTVVEGEAPGAMTGLPVPTHAFVGGSSGNLREILNMLLDKNPRIRVVINAITLETLAEVMQCAGKIQLKDLEIKSVSVADAREVGRYHMMTAQNPVFVISFGGAG